MFLFAILVLQAAFVFLGKRGILSSMGAASIAVLAAVVAYFVAVILLFPAIPLMRTAGIISGSITLIFVFASTITCFRAGVSDLEVIDAIQVVGEDDDRIFDIDGRKDETPGDRDAVPEEPRESLQQDSQAHSDIPHTTAVPLVEESEQKVKLVEELDSLWNEYVSRGRDGAVPVSGDFSFLMRDPIGQADDIGLLDEPIDLTEGIEFLETDTSPNRDAETGGETEKTSSGSVQTNNTLDQLLPDVAGTKMREKSDRPDSPEPDLKYPLKCHFKVMEAASGKLLGNYYGDEGYSSLDLVTLSALLGEKLGSGDLRIVNLNWSNFDEIEVHIETDAGTVRSSARLDGRPAETKTSVDLEADSSASEKKPLIEEIALPKDNAKKVKASVSNAVAPRYLIYDRRTIQPLGEYFPEGARPRIDRLTLHRMLPAYDFRTFQIDSIRWQEGEVRIFIKGEKKKSPESSLRQASSDKSVISHNRKVKNPEESPEVQDLKPKETEESD
jgi:hypothetical protein